MSADFSYIEYGSASEANVQIARLIGQHLRDAIIRRDKASLLLSGGSTPGPAYRTLAQDDLDWSKVSIGLVDDRWVPETDKGSNGALIRRAIETGFARHANLIPMLTKHATPSDGLDAIEHNMADIIKSPDICIMGMGTDGHTASWFPGSIGLEEAMDIETQQNVAAIDAAGCPVAGDYPHRITLTLPAVMRAKHIILFITGKIKKRVWESSVHNSVFENPVTALRSAGNRLTVIWAP